MLVTPSTIGTICGAPSTGYIVKLYLVAADDIVIGEPAIVSSAVAVELAEGATIYEVPLLPKTATLTEGSALSAAGYSYAVGISTFCHAVTNAAVVSWAQEQGLKRWVAICQTATGGVFLAGDSQHGLRLSVARSATERHLINITLSATVPHRLWRLTSADPSVLFPTGILEVVGSNCGAPSSGYLTDLYLLALEDILYTQEPPTGSETASIWPINTATVFRLPLRVKTATYSENSQEAEGGLSYAVNLSTFYHAINNAEVTDWAQEQGQKRFVALFRTTTGDFFLAGDHGHGLRLSVARNTTERHLISITLSGTIPHRLWRLESVDPTVLFDIVDFSPADFSSTDFSQ